MNHSTRQVGPRSAGSGEGRLIRDQHNLEHDSVVAQGRKPTTLTDAQDAQIGTENDQRTTPITESVRGRTGCARSRGAGSQGGTGTKGKTRTMFDDTENADEDGDDGRTEPTELYGFELPDGNEDETDRDGFLSAQAEVHALAVGVLAGMTGHIDLILLFVMFLVGEFDGMRKSEHLVDAAREPAYAALGIVSGVAFHIALWGQITGGFIFG